MGLICGLLLPVLFFTLIVIDHIKAFLRSVMWTSMWTLFIYLLWRTWILCLVTYNFTHIYEFLLFYSILNPRNPSDKWKNYSNKVWVWKFLRCGRIIWPKFSAKIFNYLHVSFVCDPIFNKIFCERIYHPSVCTLPHISNRPFLKNISLLHPFPPPSLLRKEIACEVF